MPLKLITLSYKTCLLYVQQTTLKENTYTQLFGREKSWKRKEDSPAVSLTCLSSDSSLWLPISSSTSRGNGITWLSFGWRVNRTSGGNDGSIVGEIVLDRLIIPPFGTGTARSQRNTCIRMGTFACRCKDNFWLREMVSKHLTAPVGAMIHGSTFWLDILDTTKSLHSFLASL